MRDTWNATKICDFWARGITVDNKGIIYYTTDEHIYQLRQDNDTEPQILVNIFEARLCGIVWNGNNIFYVCDQGNHRILSYSIDTGNISTVAGNGYGHKDGNFKNSEFCNPFGIAMDRNGDLYITELHCIRKLSLSSGTVITIAGSEYEGYKDGDAKQALFHVPIGIVVSEDYTIYVADQCNDCIRKIKDGIVSTIAGAPGTDGFQDGRLSQAEFQVPKPLVLDVDGNLLIGDDNGVRRVDLNQQIVSTLQLVPSMFITSLAISNKFELYVGALQCIMKLENRWKWMRFIWIGHLKENPNDCLLATLPRDIIKEITQFM